METRLTMKVILLALLIASASADNYCKGVFIGENYYNVDIVKEGLNRVHQIVFNRNDNTAYFTFEQIAEIPTRMLGYVKLDNKSAGIIDGVRNATGLDIDQTLNRLYVGGSDGLFMINLNSENKVPEKLPVNDNIKSVFFKDNVIYFVNMKREPKRFEFGQVYPITELTNQHVDKIIVDDDSNLHYLQVHKLSRVKIGSASVVSQDKLYVYDIAVDVNSKPYVAAKDGLYVYNKYKYVLDKVGINLKDIKKLTFVTVDVPMYIVADILVRLIKNPIPCLRDQN